MVGESGIVRDVNSPARGSVARVTQRSAVFNLFMPHVCAPLNSYGVCPSGPPPCPARVPPAAVRVRLSAAPNAPRRQRRAVRPKARVRELAPSRHAAPAAHCQLGRGLRGKSARVVCVVARRPVASRPRHAVTGGGSGSGRWR